MTGLYLISPPQIKNIDKFIQKLQNILHNTTKINLFQLRLKNQDMEYQDMERNYVQFLQKYIQPISHVCRKYNVKFILNDGYRFIKIHNQITHNQCEQNNIIQFIDGIHVGDQDIEDYNKLSEIKKIYPNLIIGTSCYDNEKLAQKTSQNHLDYLSFGAVFHTNTKLAKSRADLTLIKKYYQLYNDEKTKTKIVTIGGITLQNLDKVNIIPYCHYLAVIGYVWNNINQEVQAVKKIEEYIDKNATNIT